MKRRSLILMIGLMSAAALPGCQIQEHPWSGELYKEPTGHANPAQSTYAPMPSILPSVDGSDFGFDEPIDDLTSSAK